MDNMNRLIELTEELSSLIEALWPNATDTSVAIGNNGYADICVTQFDNDEETPIKDRKRRRLFNSTKYKGEWRPDYSETQNIYYKAIGVLLEDSK